VLADVGLTRAYPPDMDPKYALRGQALHETIAWYLAGELDVASIHPELRGGFKAFLEFEQATSFVAVATEETLVHATYGYVGTLDARGKVNGLHAIVDWKFTQSVDAAGARLQLAGYGLLSSHCHPAPAIERHYVVQLGKDGHHKLLDMTDEHATQVFLAALIVWRERNRNG
jgi:hypothetical protein